MIKKILFILLAILSSQNIWAQNQQFCLNDTIPPNVVYCPKDTVILLEGISTYSSQLPMPIFEDNCGIASILSNIGIEPLYLGNFIANYTAIDSTGNKTSCYHSVTLGKKNQDGNTCNGNLLQNSTFSDSLDFWNSQNATMSTAFPSPIHLEIKQNGYISQKVPAKPNFEYLGYIYSSGQYKTKVSFFDASNTLLLPPIISLSTNIRTIAPDKTVWVEVLIENLDTIAMPLFNVCLIEQPSTSMYLNAGCPNTFIDGNYHIKGYTPQGEMEFFRNLAQDSFEVCTFDGNGFSNCRMIVENQDTIAGLVNSTNIELSNGNNIIISQAIPASIKARFDRFINVHFADNFFYLVGIDKQDLETVLILKLDFTLSSIVTETQNKHFIYKSGDTKSTLLGKIAIVLLGELSGTTLLYSNGALFSTQSLKKIKNNAERFLDFKYLFDNIIQVNAIDRNTTSFQGSSHSFLTSSVLKLENDSLYPISKFSNLEAINSTGLGRSGAFKSYIPSFADIHIDYSTSYSIHSYFQISNIFFENYLTISKDGVLNSAPTILLSNSPLGIPLMSNYGNSNLANHGFFESEGRIYRFLNYMDSTLEIQRIDCELNAPAISCPANLLKNPTLQNNQQHWQSQGAKPQNGTIQLCEKGDFIQQTLSAEAGKTYKLELKAQSQTANHSLRFGLKFMDANWQTIENYATDFELQTAFSSDFIEKTAPNGSVWMEITAINENGACLQIKEICLTNPNGNSSPTPDLELSIKSDVVNPSLWSAVPFTVHLENKGTETMHDIQVQLPAQMDADFSDKMAYVSHSADAGSSFNYWSGVWKIPKLELGESVDLNYTVFRKTNEAISIFAQIIEQRPLDLDSKPANNATQLPSEDDEALLVFDMASFIQNRVDLAQSKVQGEARIFPNPTSQVLFIDLTDYDGLEVSLTLVDALGRSVQSQEVAGSHSLARAEMDVRGLENGLYFLKIESAEMRPLVVRVLVEHGR